jgi:hypothetical protein
MSKCHATVKQEDERKAPLRIAAMRATQGFVPAGACIIGRLTSENLSDAFFFPFAITRKELIAI